jgi:pSer/pThr/pTyr-binding forkhead associated (FHA) protein
LYLFFLRVLRAVWAEVSPVRTAAPVPAGTAKPAKKPARKARGRSRNALVVVEPADKKGRAYDLADEITLGRAAGCTVTLDDNYVSQLHARVTRRDGVLYAEDLGSTNGTYVNGKKLTGEVLLKRGDQVRIGSTVLEVDA